LVVFIQGDDDDATTARLKSRHTENNEYEDPEDEEEEIGTILNRVILIFITTSILFQRVIMRMMKLWMKN